MKTENIYYEGNYVHQLCCSSMHILLFDNVGYYTRNLKVIAIESHINPRLSVHSSFVLKLKRNNVRILAING